MDVTCRYTHPYFINKAKILISSVVNKELKWDLSIKTVRLEFAVSVFIIKSFEDTYSIGTSSI
jgi:hypothetical protein